jgi:hypothetical protein
MKNKVYIGLLILGLGGLGLAFSSFKNAKTSTKEYMTVTTIESLIPMGLGRSRMITTTSEGSDDAKMLNFFSGVGINFQNITQNTEDITAKLNQLATEGWELESTSTGVQGSNKDAQGLFITRYILEKDME